MDAAERPGARARRPEPAARASSGDVHGERAPVRIQAGSVRTVHMALLTVTLTLAIFHTALQPPAAQATFEAQVKAAFLYNFTKFVDWPPAAMADQDPF